MTLVMLGSEDYGDDGGVLHTRDQLSAMIESLDATALARPLTV